MAKSTDTKRAAGRPKSETTRETRSFRFDPDFYAEFLAAVESIEPRTTATAVIEMLISEWLRGRGKDT